MTRFDAEKLKLLQSEGFRVGFNQEGEIEQLPDWAESINLTGDLVPGLQLFTRDGRFCGNAHIIKSEIKTYSSWSGEVYEVITDAGSVMNMTISEINGLFYVGKYISDVSRILNRFDHDGVFREYQGEK